MENDEIEIQFDCYVVGISSDGVNGPQSNTVRASDVIGPTLQADLTGVGAGSWACGGGNTSTGVSQDTGIVGTICDLSTAAGGDGISSTIDQIVIAPNEELEEEWAEMETNYTLSNLASGTVPTVTTAVYTADVDGTAANEAAIKLTLSASLTPDQIAATVVGTGLNGLLQTVNAGDTQLVATNAGVDTDVLSTAGAFLAGAGDAGICIWFGPDGTSDTTLVPDDVLAVGYAGITAGADGDCDSIANTAPVLSSDDVQVVAVGARSGVCGLEAAGGAPADVIELGDDEDTTAGVGGGLILTGNDGLCSTDAPAYALAVPTGSLLILPGASTASSAGLVPGGDFDLDSTLLNTDPTCVAPIVCEDTLEGSRLTAALVTDVAGNAIRDASSSPVGADEFWSDGSVR